MFAQVTFPSGRYFAARVDDPSLPEWPPHPSRLFAAMVASAYRSAPGMNEERRRMLEWFEALPAPRIAAPGADLGRAPVTYVPPGDSVGRKGKKGEEEHEHGIHRWRQPRHFPSAVLLGDPVVGFGWDQDPEPSDLRILDEIARGITHIGTSHAMASVQIQGGDLPLPVTWYPHQDGTEFIRVPVAGRLAELDAVYAAKSGLRRPIPAHEPLVAYRQVTQVEAGTCLSPWELLCLRLDGVQQDVDDPAYLARAVRRAMMAVLGEAAHPAVHGHAGGDHVAWLPLADVGHERAKGRVIGLGIALPRSLGLEERSSILSGLAALEGVRLPDGRVAVLRAHLPGEPVPKALMRRTWTHPAREWASVTPVVLDRPPKRAEPEKLRTAMIESLVLAGFPEPEDVTLSSFSQFQGAPPAFQVPSPDRKPRYHAIVRFPQAVGGPVIAGRSRFFGIGLFRPLPAQGGATA